MKKDVTLFNIMVVNTGYLLFLSFVAVDCNLEDNSLIYSDSCDCSHISQLGNSTVGKAPKDLNTHC